MIIEIIGTFSAATQETVSVLGHKQGCVYDWWLFAPLVCVSTIVLVSSELHLGLTFIATSLVEKEVLPSVSN